ncbi:hypothetical protein H696_00152 [Fonticula alba]|uniref:SGNH hydrolase-type esterase domain-containing protein n=1 Tax=Fonticula alba TaxID=691883 RepID=A0A058ZF31_FONAL|nr:hypothetical protein H696_00152 [Fonticula alba]KCV72561.1 hypothetical protein H696_00152 [Fonticula alba]|eukprot:XP_009492262.1 hypothetical protein H696_00152 [Fonticula alba]
MTTAPIGVPAPGTILLLPSDPLTAADRTDSPLQWVPFYNAGMCSFSVITKAPEGAGPPAAVHILLHVGPRAYLLSCEAATHGRFDPQHPCPGLAVDRLPDHGTSAGLVLRQVATLLPPPKPLGSGAPARMDYFQTAKQSPQLGLLDELTAVERLPTAVPLWAHWLPAAGGSASAIGATSAEPVLAEPPPGGLHLYPAGPWTPAHIPTPPTDLQGDGRWFNLASGVLTACLDRLHGHRQLLRAASPSPARLRPVILLAGDSIAQQLGRSEAWARRCAGTWSAPPLSPAGLPPLVLEFGLGGDQTQHLLLRLAGIKNALRLTAARARILGPADSRPSLATSGVSPTSGQACPLNLTGILIVGTNNAFHRPDEVARGIHEAALELGRVLVQALGFLCPDPEASVSSGPAGTPHHHIRVLVCGIPPRGETDNAARQRAAQTNAILRHMLARPTSPQTAPVEIVPLWDPFLTAPPTAVANETAGPFRQAGIDRLTRDTLYTDMLHFTEQGHATICDALDRHISRANAGQ